MATATATMDTAGYFLVSFTVEKINKSGMFMSMCIIYIYIVVYVFSVCGRFVFVHSVYVYMYVDVILCMAYHHSYKGCSSAAILGMYIQELW